jgi:hypothetical protein
MDENQGEFGEVRKYKNYEIISAVNNNCLKSINKIEFT